MPTGPTGRRTRRLLLAVLAAIIVAVGGPALAGRSVPAHAQDESGTATKGTLLYKSDDPEQTDKLPVEGAEVVVYSATLSADGRSVDQLGDEVGRATTDAEGKFFVPLPAAGDYAIELQVDTLPDGVELVNEDRSTLAVRVATDQQKSALFNLAEGDAAASARTRTSDSRWDRGARLFVDGIKFGLIIGMCAIGLSLIYGTTGLVNFAHSELVTFGAVIAYVFNALVGLNLILAAGLTVLVAAAFGGLLDIGLWRPLRRRGTGLVAMMIISIGLSIGLRYAILYQFGDRSRPYVDYAVQTKPLFTLGPVNIIPKDFVMIVVSAVLLVGIALALRMTKLGKAMRAVSDNPDLASSTGIDVNRIVTMVWMIGAALTAVGGIFQGLSDLTNWTMGQQLLLLIFAAVTLGGLGTDFGAIAGSLVVGVFIYLSTLWLAPELKNVGALLVMILILLVRPQGIFGRAQRIG